MRFEREAGDLVVPPWSSVRRVQLIRREIREYLPASTIELLLSAAETIVEGGGAEKTAVAPALAGERGEQIYASIMTTIDLTAIADMFREPADAATALKIAELMSDHDIVRRKLTDRARAAIASLGGGDLPFPTTGAMDLSLDYQVRATESTVLIDADVVASKRKPRSHAS